MFDPYLPYAPPLEPVVPVPAPRVLGRMGFLRSTDHKPAIHIQPQDGKRQSALPDASYEERDVWIDDLRGRTDGLSLDREGLVFVERPSAVTDWLDEEQIVGVYYPEARDLVRAHTGAQEVIIFDHTLRALAPETRQAHRTRETVSFMHADYTPKSGPQRIRDMLGERAQKVGRVAFFNLWRPINDAAEARPLAYVDGTTLNPKSLIATDLVYPDRVGEVYHQAFDPGHRHVYLSYQQPEEVALFKTFDTREDVTCFVPHGSFQKRSGPKVEGDRMSIELRSIALF